MVLWVCKAITKDYTPEGGKEMYNLKYFEENKQLVFDDPYGGFAYDLDGHRIGVAACDRSRYFMVFVDGQMIATRAKRSNAIRLALDYLNK